MNIIMTGSTSFVGAATVRELLRRGHTVTAIVRPKSSKLDTILEGNEEALLSGRLLVRIRERVKNGQGASGEEYGDLSGDDSDGESPRL